MGRSRALLLLLAVAGPLAAGDPSNPFKGPVRSVSDAAGRLSLTIPEKWQTQAVSGSELLHAFAPSHLGMGGHDLLAVAEAGQVDRERQRKRYLDYDGAKDPDARFQNVDQPYFGYRVDLTREGRKLVLVRVFLVSGNDGVVLTVTSRLENYDTVWAEQIQAVAASAKTAAAERPAGDAEVAGAGSKRRITDSKARISLVLTEKWKTLPTQEASEWLALSYGTSESAARAVFSERGVTPTAALVLTKVYAEWKQAYADIHLERLDGEPPRMLVRNRKPDHIDYIIAMQAGRQGYTLMLTARVGEFERVRAAADELAASIVILGAPYQEPVAPPDPVVKTVGVTVALHLPAGMGKAADALAALIDPFWKAAQPFRFGDWRRVGPLRIRIVEERTFEEASHLFGVRPSAYDPLARLVIATPPPEAEPATYQGLLYASLAANFLHRDLPFPAPPWFREGVAACLEAAGRGGGAPDAAHPALAARLLPRAESGSIIALRDLLHLGEADFASAETPDLRAASWGYVHYLAFGRGPESAAYRKWTKSFAQARDAAPDFDLKACEKAAENLAKHALKLWGSNR
ncbi:MAG: hypothetical protein ACT4PV_04090 [Planctomycetaceae bacterium]